MAAFELHWVLPDPTRERAVDALGMSAQADRLADILLPGLSVLTVRARYFTFLCWAIERTQGTSNARRAVHRLEAELAIAEARRHGADGAKECPAVVGRGSARSYLDDHDDAAPTRPERLYKNTALSRYAPAMRALGLLGRGRSEVQPSTRRLASAYRAANARGVACLGEMTSRERTLVRQALGLDWRVPDGALGAAARRRRATYDVVHRIAWTDAGAAAVLEHHSAAHRARDGVPRLLHMAYVWEALSCGLSLVFREILRRRDLAALRRGLRRARAAGARRPSLVDVDRTYDDADADPLPGAVALVRAALRRGPEKLGLEPEACALGELVVTGGSGSEALTSLVSRHVLAKPEDPWMRMRGDHVEILAPQKRVQEFRVRPRSYRLDAFHRLLFDIGLDP